MKELLLKNKNKLDAKKLVKKYLASREDVYDWSIIESVTATGITRIKAEVTSLTWQGTVWKHYVLLYVPTTVNFNNIYTLIDGGRLTGGIPDRVDETSPIYGPFLSLMRGFSAATGMIMTFIRNIPNTPTLGNSTEDEFIYTSVQKYLATRDTNWSPFNPMTKGVMQCFTAIQQIVAQEKGVYLVGYCAAGLSKRGWTAYLAGVHDSRCNALVPIVQDNINISESYRRRRDVYGEDDVKLLQSELFEYMGMLAGNLKPLGREILEVVDPYALRDKLTMPMYVITSTNDENFTIDSATYYIKGFEDAQLAYQRNLGHDIDPQYLMASIYWYLKLNLGQATPKITWTRNIDENNLTFTITVTQTGWSEVNVISATSTTENFLASSFTTTSTSVSGTTFDVVIPRDNTNFKASYVEVVYNTPTGLPAPYNTIRFAVCTEAVITQKI